MFLEKHFTPFSKFGPTCLNLWWPNAKKTAFHKLRGMCVAITKLVGSLLKKKVQIQQATNQQRNKTERFEQRSFYCTKNKTKDTPHRTI